jgi:hypothetical protein
MGVKVIIEGDENPGFLEKLRTIKISFKNNLTTEELIAEMEKKLDSKVWIDPSGEWHFKPNKKE